MSNGFSRKRTYIFSYYNIRAYIQTIVSQKTMIHVILWKCIINILVLSSGGRFSCEHTRNIGETREPRTMRCFRFLFLAWHSFWAVLLSARGGHLVSPPPILLLFPFPEVQEWTTLAKSLQLPDRYRTDLHTDASRPTKANPKTQRKCNMHRKHLRDWNKFSKKKNQRASDLNSNKGTWISDYFLYKNCTYKATRIKFQIDKFCIRMYLYIILSIHIWRKSSW